MLKCVRFDLSYPSGHSQALTDITVGLSRIQENIWQPLADLYNSGTTYCTTHVKEMYQKNVSNPSFRAVCDANSILITAVLSLFI